MASSNGSTEFNDAWAQEKRWNTFQETRQQKTVKLSAARSVKKKLSELSKQERAAASAVPLDLLAKEWLNEQNASIDMRCYLVEKLLPTLVIGLEKLLTQVSLRDLADSTEQQPDFNPINFVAQYLMRNNPSYSNFAEAHPYCRSMRQVSEELKRVAYSVSENKLAELKSKTKLRRSARERQEAYRAAEENRRVELLKGAYAKWIVPIEDGIPISDVKLAVESWLGLMSEHQTATSLLDLFTVLLHSEEQLLWEDSFVQAVMECGSELPTDVFHLLVDHLGVCGSERRRQKLRERRRALLAAVFEDCDPDKTFVVDRLRMLHLFTCYYDSLSKDAQEKLHNPRRWPIVEVTEAEEIEEDEDQRLSSATTSSLSEQDLQDFLAAGADEDNTTTTDGEVLSDGQHSGEKEKDKVSGVEVGGVGDGQHSGEKEKDKVSGIEVGGVGDGQGSSDTKEGGDSTSKGAEESGKEVSFDEPPVTSEDATKTTGEEEKKVSSDVDDATPTTKDVDDATPSTKDVDDATPTTKELEDATPTTKDSDDVTPTTKDADDATPTTKDTTPTSDDTSPVAKENESADTTKPEDEATPSKDIQSEVPPPSSMLERRLTGDNYSRAMSLSRMRKLSGMSERPVTPSGPGGAWDHFMLSCAQFVQLVELYLGPEPKDELVDAVSTYIRENYTETAQERAERLERAQQQAFSLTKRQRVASLFETWDNDRSGFLELEEVQLVLSKWRGFSNEQAQEHAEDILASLGAHHKRLTRSQFQTYIDHLTDGMELSEFEDFAEYLMASVKLTFEELRRGEQRKEFLVRIGLAGKTSCLQFNSAMRAAISVLHQDIREFGGDKNCTVAIGLLEPSTRQPDTLCLSYKASSGSIELKVVGRKLQRSFKEGVSFLAVDAGRPVHVANIQKHRGVYFFIPEHKGEEYKGSLVVSPIITPHQAVVGTISIDSLTASSARDDTSDHTNFLTHEINFYQGVGVCLGEVFYWINVRQKLLKVAQSALSWVHRRCPKVQEGAVYIVQPSGEPDIPYNLCCMLTTTSSDGANKITNQIFKRCENLFREYLFQCVDNSEPISADAYGRHHLAYPIRDHTGCAVAVVDLCMPPTHSLNPHQMREVIKVLKLLTVAYYQLSFVPEQKLDEDGEPPDSSKPHSANRVKDVDLAVLFDQLMLTDLREKVAKVNKKVFAELRSYIDPPVVIHRVIQALLYILHPQGDFNTWAQCRLFITMSLVTALEMYDPLKVETHPKLELIKQILDGVSVSSIHDHGSLPAKYIHGWVNVCVSLLGHSATNPVSNKDLPPSTASAIKRLKSDGSDHRSCPTSGISTISDEQQSATSRGGSAEANGEGVAHSKPNSATNSTSAITGAGVTSSSDLKSSNSKGNINGGTDS